MGRTVARVPGKPMMDFPRDLFPSTPLTQTAINEAFSAPDELHYLVRSDTAEVVALAAGRRSDLAPLPSDGGAVRSRLFWSPVHSWPFEAAAELPAGTARRQLRLLSSHAPR